MERRSSVHWSLTGRFTEPVTHNVVLMCLLAQHRPAVSSLRAQVAQFGAHVDRQQPARRSAAPPRRWQVSRWRPSAGAPPTSPPSSCPSSCAPAPPTRRVPARRPTRITGRQPTIRSRPSRSWRCCSRPCSRARRASPCGAPDGHSRRLASSSGRLTPADSSAAAAACRRALGPRRVVGATGRSGAVRSSDGVWRIQGPRPWQAGSTRQVARGAEALCLSLPTARRCLRRGPR
eukprot:scaffold132045_cov72-Phaeocystis_antarctica.AAC.5